MSFKMRVIEDSIDLQTMIKASDEAGQKIMKKCAAILKVRVAGRLRAEQKPRYNKDGHQLKRPRVVHMSDDVVIKTGKDKYGYHYAKVGGGKHTGTIWHIVNDGTYKNKATHFMDNAIKESENEIASIIDQELRKVIK